MTTIYLHIDEWVMFAKWASLQLYHGKNKLHIGFVMLAHWNNSVCVDMSLHSDKLLSKFQANLSLVVHFNAVCVREKQ